MQAVVAEERPPVLEIQLVIADLLRQLRDRRGCCRSPPDRSAGRPAAHMNIQCSDDPVQPAIAVAAADVGMHARNHSSVSVEAGSALVVAEPRQRKELAALVERHRVTAGLHVVGQGQHVTGVDVPARHAELAHHVVHADERILTSGICRSISLASDIASAAPRLNPTMSTAVSPASRLFCRRFIACRTRAWPPMPNASATARPTNVSARRPIPFK